MTEDKKETDIERAINKIGRLRTEDEKRDESRERQKGLKKTETEKKKELKKWGKT